MSICKSCGESFTIGKEDFAFYEKIGVQMPTFCPQCREKRRLAYRNERNLYTRQSSLSGEKIISNYSSDKPYKVYSQKEWWGDAWDGLSYGRPFDFSKPFFEQFKELILEVPRMNLAIWQSENCDYCNYIDFSKNCYLVFGASNCQDTYYSNRVDQTRDCLDLESSKDMELCYDSIDCVHCNRVIGSIKCENSHDLLFCYDCKNCEECILSSNLIGKKYYIENKPYSREEYFEKKRAIAVSRFSSYQKLKMHFQGVRQNAIHEFAKLVNCENCTGDNLTNSKNAQECYESAKLQDCKFVQFSMNCTDSYDITGSSKLGCELSAEGMSIEGKNIFCGFYIGGTSNVYCSDSIVAGSDIFGCTGLKRKQYCILNKPYGKAEYGRILPAVISHMRKTGEWGEFFPESISPFKYEESVAAEYFPRERHGERVAESEARDLPSIPDAIKDVSDEILRQILQCDACWKNFKIIPQELRFYRMLEIPVPRSCPNCRHRARVKLKNPRHLWNRACDSCGSAIATAFPPRIDRVFCKKCYLMKVY